MELAVEPHPESRWIRLRVRGTLDAAGRQVLRERMVAPENTRDGLSQLVDFREADGTGLDVQTVRAFARALARSDRQTVGRRAVVVASRLAWGMSRLAAGTTGATEETVRVFETLEEAEAWLAADAG
jgi:hypothetical protein